MIILESISIVILTVFVIACFGTGLENGTMGAYVVGMFLLIPLVTIILEVFIW